jgi:pimeloyl-ACP methyl ester carboxylesterase
MSSRAIVFLPGAAGAGEYWTPVVDRLPATWRARTIDLPGLGAVPASAGIASYRDLADYVAARMTTPAVLVAQSMGSVIALEIALRYPARVTHLVLVAATGGIDVAAHGAADWRADYAEAYPHAELWASAPVPDLTHRLTEIQVPVLLIWPTADVLSPLGVAHFLASKIPTTSLVTFDSDDHWVARQFATETARAIHQFAEPELL